VIAKLGQSGVRTWRFASVTRRQTDALSPARCLRAWQPWWQPSLDGHCPKQRRLAFVADGTWLRTEPGSGASEPSGPRGHEARIACVIGSESLLSHQETWLAPSRRQSTSGLCSPCGCTALGTVSLAVEACLRRLDTRRRKNLPPAEWFSREVALVVAKLGRPIPRTVEVRLLRPRCLVCHSATRAWLCFAGFAIRSGWTSCPVASGAENAAQVRLASTAT
jgi:hypothetical protein